jgi:acyl-CoA synthetase (AMP-forming)/AMP-acid ligase II
VEILVLRAEIAPAGEIVLGELTLRNARLRGDAPAILCDGRALSHRQFAERALRLVDALARRGIGRGERVAVLAQNCPEYLECYAAGELGGWTTVTINYRLAAPEVAYIVGDSKPKLIIVEEAYRHLLSAEVTASVDGVLVIGGDGSYEAAIASGEPNAPPAVRPDDIAYLIYTSGTTGRPKGVMLTQRGMLRAGYISTIVGIIAPTDRLGLIMPLYHIGGRIQTLAHQVAGATIVLHRAFRPAEFLRSLQDNAITTTLMAPTMLGDMLEQDGFDRAHLPALKALHYSAAPMPEALLRRGIAALGPMFVQQYGMTETGAPGCILQAYQHVLDGPEHVVRRLRSAGQPMIGCDVRILRPDGSEAAPGEAGEVVIGGESVMAGYWNNHVATAATLRDGRVHTGDVGERDEDGFIFIVDRLKEMIVSGGENIYSREVENALMSHPGVLEAAVVGGPDPRWGETVVAFIVKRPGHDVAAEALIEHCRAAIAPYKRPRDVRFIDQLPKLPNGKIEKFKLRAPLWAGRDRAV